MKYTKRQIVEAIEYWTKLLAESDSDVQTDTGKTAREQSEVLWSKLNISELRQALDLMRKNYDAFKTAMEFDRDKIEMLGFASHQYAESEAELKRLENAIFDLAMIAEG